MNRKTLFLVAALALIGAVAYGVKEYMRGHADVAGMHAAHAVDARQLLADFIADDAAARAKYVGEKEQAIEVVGIIRAVEPGDGAALANVVLETGDEMAGIACEFAPGNLPPEWKAGDEVRVKGICQGYTGEGMMPGDVVLQRCVPVVR
ncbi:MAG: OB-fold protein [Flavobacteriales bacterium]